MKANLLKTADEAVKRVRGEGILDIFQFDSGNSKEPISQITGHPTDLMKLKGIREIEENIVPDTYTVYVRMGAKKLKQMIEKI